MDDYDREFSESTHLYDTKRDQRDREGAFNNSNQALAADYVRDDESALGCLQPNYFTASTLIRLNTYYPCICFEKLLNLSRFDGTGREWRQEINALRGLTKFFF